MPDPRLDRGREALVAVSAAVAAGDAGRLSDALRRAAAVAAHPQVEEALLQSYLFLGYPAALNAFGAWRAITGDPPAPIDDEPAVWPARGAEVCRAVYGGQYDRLRENIRVLHPDMERWMVGEGYGKVLGRPGLSLVDRELCIVGILAVIDAPAQLYSHLRGALNVGASSGEIEHALEVAALASSPERTAAAGDTWRRLSDRLRPAEETD